MASLLSKAKSSTEARKYRDGENRLPPKYFGSIEELPISSPVDALMLFERVVADPKLWLVQAAPGSANERGLYRRSLQPLPKSKGKPDKGTDPAGLVTPPSVEMLVFDLDHGRWPDGCCPETPPAETAAALVAELCEQLGRPLTTAVVAFSGNHLFKGCRAKVVFIPGRPLTWELAKALYERAGSDPAFANAAQPLFVAPPVLDAGELDPLPDGRVFFVPAEVNRLDCSPHAGDVAPATWAALRSLRAQLEKTEDGGARHPIVNKGTFSVAGVAAGEGVPVGLVADAVLRMCQTIPTFADRDFEDEIRRAAESGYAKPIKPVETLLVCNGEGVPKPLLTNAVVLLSRSVRFAQNDFGDHELTAAPPWDLKGEYPRSVEEHQLREATSWLQSESHVGFKKADVSDAIAMLAGNNPVDRLRNYLEHCATQPRGKLTLDNAAVVGWGAKDTPAHRLAIRRFMLQSVARAYNPGCTGELVLVLHAPPGRGKGRSAWQLFTRPGKRYFTSSHISIGSQAQHAPILHGLWGAELGEQRSVSAWHNDQFKAFVSMRKIKYRAPYDRRASEILLRVNYIWTTEYETPLTDDNWRRFLILEVGKWQEPAPVEIDRLWGEAVRAFKAGERAWLDVEDEAILRPARELAYSIDALEHSIEDILHAPEFEDNPRAIDAVVRILAMRPYYGVKVSDAAIRHRVGKVMKRLGWDNRPTWIDGKTTRQYFPPDGWTFKNVSGEATDVTATY